MPYEHFSVGSGPTAPGSNPEPGFMINNGTQFDSTGFLTISGALAGLENTADDPEWAPYNRMIQAPTVNSGADQPFGIYVWQQDKILDQNPVGGAWRVVHTVTGQENLLDYGIKTGLIRLIGTDGRPYLVGIYPGSGANQVGMVKFDVLTDTWTSEVFDLTTKFSNCTYAFPHDGLVYLASEGDLYIANPAGNSLVSVPNSAAVGSDWRDKVFVLNGRVLIASIAGSNMRIYEYFGSFKLLSTVSAANLSVQSEFGVLYTFDKAYLFFYDNLKDRKCFEVEATSDELFESLSVSDVTLAVISTPPGLTTDNRMWCFQEMEINPKGEFDGYVVIQEQLVVTSNRYNGAWACSRFTGPTTPVVAVGVNPSGQHTYFSNPRGGGDMIHKGAAVTDKVQVSVMGFEEPETPPMGLPSGVLGVKFAVFGATGAPATQALRLLFATEDDDPSGIATTQGTIVSSSQGILDGSGRLAAVPVTANSGLQGANYYTLWWDRVGDGVDITKRHHLKLETKNSAVEFV